MQREVGLKKAYCLNNARCKARCTVFLHKTRLALSLKPTVGDFIVLVFCESVKLASLGRQYREKQAPYVTGNFLLSFGVNRMKSRGAN